MALTAEQKKLAKMLQDPELKELLGASQTDEELKDLMEDMAVDENDTLETIAKKSNAKTQKLIKYFTKKVDNAEKSAVETATKDSRAQEDAKINAFSDKNPGMKNPKVIKLMQPLYNEGSTLDEAYAVACKGLDLDPVTGETPKEETAEEKEAKAKTAKKEVKKETKGAKQSIKSSTASEEEDLDEEEDDKDRKPASLDDALAAADAAYTAKHGDPFETKD